MTTYMREVTEGGFPKSDKRVTFTAVELLEQMLSDMDHDGHTFESVDGWPAFRTGSTEFTYHVGPGLVRPIWILAELLKVGRRFHRDSPPLVSGYARIVLRKIFAKNDGLAAYGIELLTRDDEAIISDEEHYEIRGALMLLLEQSLPFDDATEVKLRRLPWTKFIQIIADYLEGNADEYLGALIAL